MSQNSSDQTYDEVVTGRRSIRGFLDRPVPRALIEEVIVLATRAPSSYNNQCWNFTVVTGEPLAAIREGNTEGILAGQPDSREFRRHDHTPDSHRARQVAVAKQLFGAMGIEREDKAGRAAAMGRNLTSFGAPVLLLCYFLRIVKEAQWSDTGMWLQTIMLLLREQGLDSCPQEFLAYYADPIMEHIGVSTETHMFFCGMGIGYRDPDAPVNSFERSRVPLEDHVRFEAALHQWIRGARVVHLLDDGPIVPEHQIITTRLLVRHILLRNRMCRRPATRESNRGVDCSASPLPVRGEMCGQAKGRRSLGATLRAQMEDEVPIDSTHCAACRPIQRCNQLLVQRIT